MARARHQTLDLFEVFAQAQLLTPEVAERVRPLLRTLLCEAAEINSQRSERQETGENNE